MSKLGSMESDLSLQEAKLVFQSSTWLGSLMERLPISPTPRTLESIVPQALAMSPHSSSWIERMILVETLLLENAITLRELIKLLLLSLSPSPQRRISLARERIRSLQCMEFPILSMDSLHSSMLEEALEELPKINKELALEIQELVHWQLDLEQEELLLSL